MAGFPDITPVHAERATQWLSQSNVRPTRQRVTLAALLMGDGRDRHVTAETLFEAASAADGKVSLATVYNTLRAFCDAGLLREIVVDGAKSYFDTDLCDHPHFFWEDSAELTDAPRESLDIRNLPAAPEGTHVVAVDVVLRLRRS
ncbi:Fur family transcriptional regulator [Loktanella sp. 3ANDIMAR09]|uniref:Ferric uptake regulation protein n=1 Tax=Loktanella gaetbuli TaxID=2881335 RepID=A0ABS8BVB9_9RHOB|nr:MULTISPECIES: transcriptional repressor [Loktanella]KQI67271.1 Fur family transcriptional regulator [Loktanella sp. 3ANDIMAR09]MCB5199692.1 transcriptional repressor [Loktanella gaetbuli]